MVDHQQVDHGRYDRFAAGISMDDRPAPHRHHSEAVEIELIRTVFHAFVPSLVMTFSFLAAGSVIYARSGDTLLLALLIAGTLASCARLACAWFFAPAARSTKLTLKQARRLELRFAIPYVGFAVLLGLFGGRAFLLPDADVHMLVMALLITYCSGVAVGMGLRLWLAIPSMILALLPVLCIALATPDAVYRTAGALVGAILVSGCQSLRAKLERSVQDISRRLTFAHLARKDALTTLPNRIALREWYDERVVAGRGMGMIAVHYLDLNNFKPVNDQYGHPTGDALLTAVGRRIAGTIRDTDIVARLGGDEFAVIQYDIQNPDEAAMLAARLTESIAQPFGIGKHTISVSAGLGYVIAKGSGEDLNHLLSLADQALYQSKRNGEISQYDAVEPLAQRVA